MKVWVLLESDIDGANPIILGIYSSEQKANIEKKEWQKNTSICRYTVRAYIINN